MSIMAKTIEMRKSVICISTADDDITKWDIAAYGRLNVRFVNGVVTCAIPTSYVKFAGRLTLRLN